MGVVYLAFQFRKAKFSPYFPNQTIRNVLTDFAVVIAILCMCVVAKVIFRDIETESLNVPDSFAPTYACCDSECRTNWPLDCPDLEHPHRQRPWIVNLFDLNGNEWVPFVAALPALLAFILVFLDDGITWHLINHPSHKLTHGAAYNYDTLVIGAMVAVNSMLGLPWLVAATVRSLNHVHALAEKSADGKIVSVQETRLTHLGIHLLCLASIFALNVLKWIPVPVLYVSTLELVSTLFGSLYVYGLGIAWYEPVLGTPHDNFHAALSVSARTSRAARPNEKDASLHASTAMAIRGVVRGQSNQASCYWISDYHCALHPLPNLHFT
eukprot:scaffold41670_cov183-Amphora_coffeaeformis.AAC.1